MEHTNAHSLVLQTYNTSNKTMVIIREKRYKSKYPTDIAAAVLVSNETYCYMLHIIIITSTGLHDKCLLALLLLSTHPS